MASIQGRKLKHIVFGLLLFISTLLTCLAEEHEYAHIGLPVVERFTSEQHKGSNQNWWLVQGNNGYIYNGTGRGITQWDGERWHFYPSPTRTLLRSISLAQDGRLYTGTMNEVGYYSENEKGDLTYYSLVSDWSFEKRQFGEVWSTASHASGVIFVTDAFMLMWDGEKLHKLQDLPKGEVRVFAIDEGFYFKAPGDTRLAKLVFSNDQADWHFTSLTLPQGAKVRTILRNKQGKLIVFTSAHGVFEQVEERLVQRLSNDAFSERADVYSAIQASDGFYYVTTLYDGLFILDEHLVIQRRYGKEHNLGSNKFYSVLEDIQGNIWLSGVPDIVKLIPPHKYSRFKTDSDLANKIGLFQGKITVISDGIFQLQKAENPFEAAKFVQLLEDNRLSWDFVEFKNNLFYGGYAGVVAHPIGGNGELGPEIKVIEGETGKAFAVTEDGKNLYASTNKGLYIVRLEGEKFVVTAIPGVRDEVIVLTLSEQGVLWGGTPTQEAYRVENALSDGARLKVNKFTAKDGLGPNNVVPFRHSSGIIIGTNDGLMDFASNRSPQLQFVKGYPEIFTTPGQDVFKLHEDHLNRLWYRIGGHTGFVAQNENGIWQADERLFKPFRFNGYKGFQVTGDEIVWFISAKGEVFRININRALTPPKQGVLNIRHVYDVNSGNLVFGGNGIASLPELEQQSNSLRFTFALAENSDAKPARYRHRLLGADNEKWSDWGGETTKDYTQLPGRHYQFEVEARDGWGRISAARVSFDVLPPWFLSKTAWFVYGVVLLILLFLSGWLTQKWRTKALRLRNLELEHQVALRTADVQAKAEELKQQQILKDRFFSNVSHEFRTPITLTIAPLQDVLKSSQHLEPGIKSAISTAIRNAQKMLSLLGQILDINKLESQNFVLKVSQYDINSIIRNLCDRFKPWVEQHHQTLEIQGVADPLLLYFDQEQLERCVANLISNAVKYSGGGSLIKVQVICEVDQVGIEVSDNGPGIAPEAEQRVFERYYQGSSSEQVSEPGTGIGLALVQELMELHHGHVELTNKVGDGCTFTLWLKRGHDHFDSRDLIDNVPVTSDSEDAFVLRTETEVIPNLGSDDEDLEVDATSLLIVDDNAELRNFISLKLQDNYRIYQACNGREGVAVARNKLPDLIISDVMMPVMDGMEMTKHIKSDPITDMIPVILLTAKATKRETVEGLSSGADDYLTKPFDTSELIARVNTIISSRKSIRAKISAQYKNESQTFESFPDKLHALITANLTDPHFNAEKLADLVALSQRSLRRKCRQELDKSVVQLITEIRMQVALDLLQNHQQQVSEIAYATGYESLAYFSRTFKKHFGFSPSSQLADNKVTG